MRILTENTSNNYTTVSPLIYRGDFDSHSTMSDIADRISSDIRFEEKLKKLYEQTQRMKAGK